MISEPMQAHEPNTEHHNMLDTLKHSYTHARKHIQDGITVIRDEFIGIYDKAESYFNIIAQPVNNFLKDLGQIDADFQREQSLDALQFNASGPRGNIIPIDQAIHGYMEENY